MEQLKKAILIFLILFSGCDRPLNNTVAVVSHVPVIPLPERPKLELMNETELAAFKALPESLKTKLVSNDTKLKIFSEQLEASIKIYNQFAQVQNQNSDAWMNTTISKDKK